LPLCLPAQPKKPLTPSTKVTRIGLIDYVRLHKEYNALKSLHESGYRNWQNVKEKYDQAVKAQDNETNQQLKQDSGQAGKRRSLIQQESERRRRLLFDNYQLEQKKLHTDRSALLLEHEKKIQLAIGQVVSEGGFTDVKPLDKNTPAGSGTDITDLVLKKLN
jgi:Skp family chaperone for outer membrane proteins